MSDSLGPNLILGALKGPEFYPTVLCLGHIIEGLPEGPCLRGLLPSL